MKRAVLFHGTDGNPSEHWFPWLKKWLEDKGYEVFAPELPENHTPDLKIYEKFLKESNWDFTENVLIGHSSGATTVLNLLSADWFPHVNSVVLVGTFLNENLTKKTEWYEPGQFDNLFLPSYSPATLKAKSDNFIFVHGDNDPYCSVDDARKLCSQVDGDLLLIKNGHHLGDSSGYKDLPGLTYKLNKIQRGD